MKLFIEFLNLFLIIGITRILILEPNKNKTLGILDKLNIYMILTILPFISLFSLFLISSGISLFILNVHKDIKAAFLLTLLSVLGVVALSIILRCFKKALRLMRSFKKDIKD